MNPMQVGQRLIELTTQDQDHIALDELYADNVVSVEAGNGDEEAQTWEGIDAVREKHAWWNGVATMHEVTAEGPYAGGGADQFVVKFGMDVTMEGQERAMMVEVGIYEVQDGKIVRETYLPLVE